MARAFNGSNTYMTVGAATSFPWAWETGFGNFTLTGWIRITSPSTGGSFNIWGNGYPTASQKGWLIYFVGGVGEQRIRFKSHATTASTIVSTAGAANSMTVANQWYFFAVRGQGFGTGLPVVFTVDTTHTNGTVSNTMAAGGTQPGTNAFRFGADPVATASTILNGGLAELAIYSRVLTNTELEGVRKYTPMEVQGQRPQHYYPFIGRQSPEVDFRANLNATLVNAPAQATHPHSNQFRRFHRLFGG